MDVAIEEGESRVSTILEDAPGVSLHRGLPTGTTGEDDIQSLDCLVVTDPALDTATADIVERRELPVVVVTDEPLSTFVDHDHIAGYVRPSEITAEKRHRLLEEVRWVTSRKTRQALRESTDRMTVLHDAATTLVGVATQEELYEQTVTVADEILSFDICYVGIVEGDEIVPKAVSADAPSDGARTMRVDEGLAGKTYQTGESQLVTRLDDSTEARPARTEYQSGISVAIPDHGVFQAVSTHPEMFDETDLTLAELLVGHVTATLKRIEAESTLREERDRLDALFENVPDAAVAFEFDGSTPIVHRVNSAFERVFGYSTEEIVGANIDEYIVPPERDGQATAFNEGLVAGASLRAEVQRLTASGPRDFLIHVVPIQLDATNSGGYAIYTDVSDQKERERQLRRQNERLDAFASIVSHDLRNPLTVADGYLEIARERHDSSELAKVADALDRMETLVGNLLTLARKGEVVGDTAPVNLAAVATEAWAHLTTGDTRLVVDEDRQLEADGPRLVELFQNLFWNAIEHGAASTVSVQTTADGFAVEDDGSGIPEELRDDVFEMGYTTSSEGTGFGLAIVRRIADAHGWDVSLEASTSGGVRFEFTV